MGRAHVAASTDYLHVNTTPVSAAPFTVACWARPVVDNARLTVMSLADSSQGNHFFDLRLDGTSSDHLRWFVVAISTTVVDTTTSFLANTWHHCCAVERASNDRSVYLDGGGEGTNTTSRVPLGVNRLSIGRLGDSTPSNDHDGGIAEAGMWDIGLSPFNIFELSQQRKAPTLVEPGHLIWYRSFRFTDFDHDPSEELLDSPLVNEPTHFSLTNFGSSFGAHPPGIIYPESLSFPWLFKAGVSEGDIFHHRTLRLAEHVLDESDATVVTKVGDYTVTLSDDVILSDASAGAVTITLPGADSAVNHRFYIKKIDSSANTVTVDGAGSDTIDGGATAVLTAENESITIVSDGTGWHIL